MRLLVPIAFLVSLSQPPAAATTFDHSAYDQVLRRHVSSEGLVAYAALHTDRSGLDAYVDSLARYSPDSDPALFPDRDHELAYWINAYNAFVLRGVIDAYPIASVKDAFLFSGFFNRQEFVAGGKKLTLDNIENDIIRPRYRDPRIHFAVNCGAISCPILENRAFGGRDLNARLEKALARFAADPRHVSSEGSALYLSKILDWYGDDFSNWFPPQRPNPATRPTIVNYLYPYLPAEIAQDLTDDAIEVTYRDYDWALNEAKAKGSPPQIEDSP